MSRNTLPRIERLEDRNLLSFDGFWIDPQSLRLSFAPQGTAVGPLETQLHQMAANEQLHRDWQLEILRAAQTWAVNANINIGLTDDDGSAFGSDGLWQGDERFGDIRIGAIPQTDDVLAVAAKGEELAGTWAGDVLLNSNYSFAVDNGGYDLFSVMLHEFGHVFGFDDDYENVDSIMYGYYQGVASGLPAMDVAALQQLYGARADDVFDAAGSNDSMSSASVLDPSVGRWQADVTRLDDLDFYQFDAGALQSGTVEISVNAKGLSLLTPRLSVFDETGALIATTESLDPADNDVSLTIETGGEGTYFVLVQGARDDVFGIGGYELGFGLEEAAVDAAIASADVFGPLDLVGPETIASSDETALSEIQSTPLSVERPQVYHFAYDSGFGGGAELTIRDAAGRIVFEASSNNGRLAENVFLLEGDYGVELRSNGPSGQLAMTGLLLPEGPTGPGGQVGPPEAYDDNYMVIHDSTLYVTVADSVLNNDYEPHGYDMFAAVDQFPTTGDLTFQSDGSFTYVPPAGFTGIVQFNYLAHNGYDWDMATVTIEVVNRPPVGVADIYYGFADTPLYVSAAEGVLANDYDDDGDQLTAVLVNGPSVGQMTFNSDGSFTFTPPPGVSGQVNFQYKAYDGLGFSETIDVTLVFDMVGGAD